MSDLATKYTAKVNLADVLSELGEEFPEFDRSTLNRYVAEAEIKNWLQVSGKPPVYPATSLPLFKWMAEQDAAGLRPKAIAAIVSPLEPGTLPLSAIPPANGGDKGETDLPALPADVMLRQIIEQSGGLLAEQFAEAIVRRVIEARLLPTEAERVRDEFLSREDAAKLLQCEPGAVSRRVPSVERGVWSMLMIQEYMAAKRNEAQEKALAKAAARAYRKRKPIVVPVETPFAIEPAASTGSTDSSEGVEL